MIIQTSKYHKFLSMLDTLNIPQHRLNLTDESDISGSLNLPKLMVTQGFNLMKS